MFGFAGDRNVGLSCLMFAQKSTDVRSILATYVSHPRSKWNGAWWPVSDMFGSVAFLVNSLTLLWFYTFGTQLFFDEDGYTTDKIDSATAILSDYDRQYGQSAIFLFFRGRLERMKVHLSRLVVKRECIVNSVFNQNDRKTLREPSKTFRSHCDSRPKTSWNCCAFMRLRGVNWCSWITTVHCIASMSYGSVQSKLILCLLVEIDAPGYHDWLANIFIGCVFVDDFQANERVLKGILHVYDNHMSRIGR